MDRRQGVLSVTTCCGHIPLSVSPAARSARPEQLILQRLGELPLVPVGLPSPVDDEQPVELR